jgi:hypothetical protein
VGRGSRRVAISLAMSLAGSHGAHEGGVVNTCTPGDGGPGAHTQQGREGAGTRPPARPPRSAEGGEGGEGGRGGKGGRGGREGGGTAARAAGPPTLPAPHSTPRYPTQSPHDPARPPRYPAQALVLYAGRVQGKEYCGRGGGVPRPKAQAPHATHTPCPRPPVPTALGFISSTRSAAPGLPDEPKAATH